MHRVIALQQLNASSDRILIRENDAAGLVGSVGCAENKQAQKQSGNDSQKHYGFKHIPEWCGRILIE